MQIAEVQAASAHNMAPDLADYEAPRVESVLSALVIEREIHYAGVIISCPGGNCPPNS